MVVRLTLAYDGTDFRGWARQGSAIRTIEGEVLPLIEAVAEQQITIAVAGRTDAGVHARGQVISFPSDLHAEQFADAIDAALAPEVRVVDARRAPAGFHARHSATAREYRYRIATGSPSASAPAASAWPRRGSLSVADMRQAAQCLLGSHDFASFGGPMVSGASTIRRLQRVAIASRGSDLTISLRANAFLHHMVRSIVGILVEVGSGRRDPGAVAEVLDARDRHAVPVLAPARGLTLERVSYAPLTAEP